MDKHTAPGLPADWLNAWLAALGATALVPDMRLSWTAEPRPVAQFEVLTGGTPAERIAEALPTAEEMDHMVIANLPQNIPVDVFPEAAGRARAERDGSLAVLTTDIGRDRRKATLGTGPFNVGAPAGETLYARLRRCRDELDGGGSLVDQIQATLDHRGRRAPVNGLGFDYTRLAGSVPGEASKYVDPVVECLCFYGLLFHPMVGDGRGPRQRGWGLRTTGRKSFKWPVWSPPLDRWAIDAILDAVYQRTVPGSSKDSESSVLSEGLQRLGVHGLYGSVPFQRTGSSDPTRGYASERLWPPSR